MTRMLQRIVQLSSPLFTNLPKTTFLGMWPIISRLQHLFPLRITQASQLVLCMSLGALALAHLSFRFVNSRYSIHSAFSASTLPGKAESHDALQEHLEDELEYVLVDYPRTPAPQHSRPDIPDISPAPVSSDESSEPITQPAAMPLSPAPSPPPPPSASFQPVPIRYDPKIFGSYIPASIYNAQKRMDYALAKLGGIEKSSRRDLERTPTAYWLRVQERKRKWREMRSKAEANKADCAKREVRKKSPEEWKAEEEEEERQDAEETKASIVELRRRLLSARAYPLPYQPHQPNVDFTPQRPLPYHYDGRKLTVPNSVEYISPTYLLSVLQDKGISSTVEEIDVKIRLWAGWEWDVEAEWDMELRQHRLHTLISAKPQDSKLISLPCLTRLSVASCNTPTTLLLERLDTPVLKQLLITVGHDAPSSLDNAAPIQGRDAKNQKPGDDCKRESKGRRIRQQKLERRRREAKDELTMAVARCLDGIPQYVESVPSNLDSLVARIPGGKDGGYVSQEVVDGLVRLKGKRAKEVTLSPKAAHC
ncbi:hypothetical protein DFP72DRAFT_262292 [Ephemerocybe angulata]|uniref:Uncharacterized protein n=1 Tax=Ephemerocybe angulata TaxID=980116 RepID=A0A8H6I161_9AGAR|nr:hypothetical protein DFP72DRAFT_262292 [Tulosesus angulatus]